MTKESGLLDNVNDGGTTISTNGWEFVCWATTNASKGGLTYWWNARYK